MAPRPGVSFLSGMNRPGVFAVSMAIHTALCVALYNALFTAFCTVFKYIWYLGSRPHLKAEHM